MGEFAIYPTNSSITNIEIIRRIFIVIETVISEHIIVIKLKIEQYTMITRNVFNILMVLGIASAISPISIITENIIDLCVLIVFTICVWIFAGTRKKIGRIEGFSMVALYLIYAVYIIIR